jgi:hypothetical protein
MSEERLKRIEAIVESNARAIQAMLEQRVSDRQRLEALEKIIGHMASLQEGLTRILSSLDEDRPTILRRLMKIEDKVDRLLERNGRE